MEEFGFYARDEDGIILLACSNAGADRQLYLEEAKKKKRPILIEIQGEVFERYQFKNYGLTVEEARNLSKELARMVDYLES